MENEKKVLIHVEDVKMHFPIKKKKTKKKKKLKKIN